MKIPRQNPKSQQPKNLTPSPVSLSRSHSGCPERPTRSSIDDAISSTAATSHNKHQHSVNNNSEEYPPSGSSPYKRRNSGSNSTHSSSSTSNEITCFSKSHKSSGHDSLQIIAEESISPEIKYKLSFDTSQQSSINIDGLLEVYGSGPENWGYLPYFQGEYINFGYWKDIEMQAYQEIPVAARKHSSVALYQKVISHLNIEPHHTVLEVGCGRGVGIIDVLAHIPHNKIIALDINSEQLKKTQTNIYKEAPNLNIEFFNANVENTNLPDHSIDRIYSVEVAQHFNSMKNFAAEMKRILVPGGQLIFTTYFLKSLPNGESLITFLPHIKDGLEKIPAVNEVSNEFLIVGFENVSYNLIGNHVFWGYDKWLKQVGSNEWSQNFYRAYQQGIIDYYVFYVN